MQNEPVFAGKTIAHRSSKELSQLGLIKRDAKAQWIVNWDSPLLKKP